MADSVQIAAFEGGSLKVFATGECGREAVLALPLNRLIVKMIRVPEERKDDPVAYATPILQAMSPYPDEPLTVGYEKVSEGPDGLIVIAAALPESSADDLAELLDAEGLRVTRVDALAFGQLRSLWPELNAAQLSGVRRLLLMKSVDCITLLALDDDLPCAIRAITDEGDLRRELMLSLLEAEDFGGSRQLSEIVVVGEIAVDGLEVFAPIRRLTYMDDEGAGIIARTQEPEALDALPASWREVLQETRFKTRLKRHLGIAIGIWILVMGVLFGVPVVYGFLTDHQKALSKEHGQLYRKVQDTKRKVELVQKYSDHSRGALEILKAVCDRLPDDVELNAWNFKRDEGVKFSGEADTANSVYELTDAMRELSMEVEEVAEDAEASEASEGEPLFHEVRRNGPTAKGVKQRFDLECLYEKEGE